MKNILCLDFDGVIVDSIEECFLNAYNSYFRYKGVRKEKIYSLEQTDPNLYEQFRKFRYLVRPAGEYFVLMHLLIGNIDNLSREIFIAEAGKRQSELFRFEKTFFSLREEMLRNKKNEWLSLHRVYPEFSEAWLQIKEKFNLFIVTNKNFEAVNSLLEYFQISIPPEKIFSYEKITSKKESVKYLASSLKISVDQITFVDDSPETIKELLEEGINAKFAQWGYAPPQISNSNSIKHLAELT